MRGLILCALIVLGFAPTARAQDGGLQVTPILIQASPRTGFASFRVHNGRDRETSFEVEVFEWSQHNGASVLTPAPDVVVAPSVFIAAANADQIVRLAIPRSVLGGAQERSYRVLLRELPGADAPVMGSRLVVEMSMPIFVTPPNARGTLQAQRVRDIHGQPALRIENTGAARLTLAQSPEAARIEDLPRYLLAGEHFIRPLPRAAETVQLIAATYGDTTTRAYSFEVQDAPALADLR